MRRNKGQTDDGIELLDVATPQATAESTERVATGGSRGNATTIAAALAVAALGVAALTSSSGSESAPPASTASAPTTLAPRPTTTSAPDRLVAQIGGGPQLVWERVEFDVDATSFEWVEDGFLGVEGSTDYVLRPNGTLTVSSNRLGEGEAPIRSSARVLGDGTSNPAELTFIGLDQERVRLIPVAIPDSDLVEPIIQLAVERQSNQVLTVQTLTGVLDVEAFSKRVNIDDRPIFDLTVSSTSITLSNDRGQEVLQIDDFVLSADDLAALRTLEEPVNQVSVAEINGIAQIVDVDLDRIDWISAIDNEFVVGGAELRRSSDGQVWEPTSIDTPQFGGLLRPGPDGVIVGLSFDGGQSFVTTSGDAARMWGETPSPLINVWQLSSVDPVVALTGWRDEAYIPSAEEWSVFTPDFELRVGGDDDSFELLTREGEQLLSGISGDANSGFRFAPGSDDIWFVDPVTGDEIARFRRALFAAAFAGARTLDGQPQLVAFADVRQPAQTEWSMIPVNELFGADALSVDFVPGDGWFLANVITTTGRELYIAEVPEDRPPQSRRHPTHGDMARADTD